VQQADAQAGEARTPRTRSLGGQAALQLAAPLLAAYQQVPLTEPLQRQLKLKKARMEDPAQGLCRCGRSRRAGRHHRRPPSRPARCTRTLAPR
jgi:hypothetical protein